MQSLAVAGQPGPRSWAQAVAPAAVAVALTLIVLSAALPWLTVFRGLQPIPGFVLEGGPLGGALILALGLLAVASTLGLGRWLRPAAGLICAAVGIEALLLQGRILEFVADPGPAGLLTQPTAGVGAVLLAVGAGLVLVVAIAVPGRATARDSLTPDRLTMSIGLFVAGWIHLLLVPEHLGSSTVLGLGFLASGVAQLALAGFVLWRPGTWNLVLVVAINVTLIAIYAYAVMVGLPFGSPEEHADARGLVVGSGERIDAYGAVSKAAEAVSIAIAFVLLSPPRHTRTSSTAEAS